jgi:hypothetical protein
MNGNSRHSTSPFGGAPACAAIRHSLSLHHLKTLETLSRKGPSPAETADDASEFLNKTTKPKPHSDFRFAATGQGFEYPQRYQVPTNQCCPPER